MIYYNVTIKLLPEIEVEWLQWMREEHIPDVLATNKFESAKLYKLLAPEDEEGITYTIQYETDTISRYESYIKLDASGMREKGFIKFGNKFIAFRSLLEEISIN